MSPTPGPARPPVSWPRRGLALVLAAAGLIGVAHMGLASESIQDAEYELKKTGVEVTGDLTFVKEVRGDREPGGSRGPPEDQMRVEYTFDGSSHTGVMECEDCRHERYVQMWVDPGDPSRYVLERGGSSMEHETSWLDWVIAAGGIAALFASLCVDRRLWSFLNFRGMSAKPRRRAVPQ